MKNIIKKISVVIALVIFAIPIFYFGISNIHYEAKDLTSNDVAIIDLDNIFRNEEFLQSYEESLIKEFGENYKEIVKKNSQSVNKAQEINKLFSLNESKVVYPDYFGGMYIDDEENLIIEVVDNLKPKKTNIKYNDFAEMINVVDDSNIKYVKNSYNELEKVNNKIEEYIQSNNPGNILAHYIDVVNNKVVVELNDYNEVEIENFRRVVLDSELINFIKGNLVSVTSTYNPGGALLDGAGNQSCSIGYRAKLSGKAGFVTAGHCTMAAGASYYNYGTIKKRQVFGSVDASFVESSHTITNTFQWSNYPYTTLSTSDYSISDLIYGNIITKVRAKTKATTGKVTNISWSGAIDQGTMTKWFTDMVYTNVYNAGGDSGGVVFVNDNNVAKLLGIVTGGNKAGANLMIATKASNIKSAFGIVRY